MAHQLYALKSGGGYACLTNDYTLRQSEGTPRAPEAGVFIASKKEESTMKQRRINATLKRALPPIAALALIALLLTILPQAGTAAPTVASLSTNPKRINESAAAHSFIRSPFVDSTPGTTTRVSAAPRLERQPLESLTALNSTEATERGAPLSAFSVPSVASVVQSPGTTTRVSAAPHPERQPLESLTALNGTEATERGASSITVSGEKRE